MKKLAIGLFVLFFVGCHSVKVTPVPKIDWIENQWEAALKKAQETKKPLLIEFGAPWCIYCNIMEATVLHDPEVVALSQKFVPLSINIDKLENKEIAKKFNVSGIPVVIATSPTGVEFSRISDPTVESLKGLMAGALASEKMAPEERKFYQGLKYEMMHDNKNAGKLYKEARPYFEKKPGWELADILYFQVDEEKNAEAAQLFLKIFNDHPMRPFVWSALCDLQKADGTKAYCQQKTWQELEKDLAQGPAAKSKDLELAYLKLKPSLAKDLRVATEQQVYLEIADIAWQRAKELSLPFLSKPYWQRAIAWKIKGGDYKQAMTLCQDRIKEYPKENTFYELLAYAYLRNHEWEKAIQAEEKVVELTPDFKKGRRVLDLVDIYAEAGDLQKAIILLKDLAKQEDGNYSEKAKAALPEFEALNNLR